MGKIPKKRNAILLHAGSHMMSQDKKLSWRRFFSCPRVKEINSLIRLLTQYNTRFEGCFQKHNPLRESSFQRCNFKMLRFLTGVFINWINQFERIRNSDQEQSAGKKFNISPRNKDDKYNYISGKSKNKQHGIKTFDIKFCLEYSMTKGKRFPGQVRKNYLSIRDLY